MNMSKLWEAGQAEIDRGRLRAKGAAEPDVAVSDRNAPPPAPTTPKTSSEWEQVITDLTTRLANATEETSQLREKKRAVSLEAAMGGHAAQRTLKEVNAELTTKSFAIDDLTTAREHAEIEMARAKAYEDGELERQRLARMASLSEKRVQAAMKWDAALQEALSAGKQVKDTLFESASEATDIEMIGINRLLTEGPWTRSVLHAGLRQFIEVPPHPGPKSNLRSLEAECRDLHERWVPKESK